MCPQELKASPSPSLVLHLRSNPSPATNHCSSLGNQALPGESVSRRAPSQPTQDWAISTPSRLPKCGWAAGRSRKETGGSAAPTDSELEPKPRPPRRLPDEHRSRPDTERVFRGQNRHRTQSTKSDVPLTNTHVSYFPQGRAFQIWREQPSDVESHSRVSPAASRPHPPGAVPTCRLPQKPGREGCHCPPATTPTDTTAAPQGPLD